MIDGLSLAKLLHAALREESPSAHIDSWGSDERLVVDGRFDLVKVASLLLADIRARFDPRKEGRAIFEIMEVLDPDGLTWADLSEHDRGFYAHVAARWAEQNEWKFVLPVDAQVKPCDN